MHSHIVLHPHEVRRWLDSHSRAHLDIGCGDGSSALAYAREHPDTAVVGLDICLDNLNRKLRKAPGNLRFIQADATLCLEVLEAQFDSGIIAFPFGSLLRGLVGGNRAAIDHILSPFKPEASVRILINESAMRAATDIMPGMPSALGPLKVALRGTTVVALNNRDIRHEPSRWARRIGYGKPSTTWLITGKKVASIHGAVIARHGLPLAQG
jgi:16S rRNA (adenine(1408)-N(1))-methyltransferase